MCMDLGRKHFGKRLRSLKKDFEGNAGPSLRRHRSAKSKGEREREKHLRFLKKERVREVKREQRYREHLSK